jgi:hypothetical protein
MIGPYLVIQSDPPMTLLSVGDNAPGLSDPIITGIGAIRRPADGSEAANLSIDLDNHDAQASQLFAVPPLRAVAILYGADGSEWFRGWLTSVVLDDNAALLIEA